MAEVKWQARRVSDGVLVDVTADVDGTPAFAPTPNAIEAGGAGIAATDGQVVFMDGTDAVGSEHFTINIGGGNPTLGISANENGNATIEGIGVGVQILIQAAEGDATHVGGELTLQAGSSAGGSGGQFNIRSGDDSGGGDGGPVVIASGYATDGTSGDIDITVGPGGNSDVGGHISLIAGTGDTGDGGDILIQAGPKVTGGSHGSVTIYEGSTTHNIELNANGLFVFGGIINFDSLPTADPAVAGQLWNDAGTLKVSAG